MCLSRCLFPRAPIGDSQQHSHPRMQPGSPSGEGDTGGDSVPGTRWVSLPDGTAYLGKHRSLGIVRTELIPWLRSSWCSKPSFLSVQCIIITSDPSLVLLCVTQGSTPSVNIHTIVFPSIYPIHLCTVDDNTSRIYLLGFISYIYMCIYIHIYMKHKLRINKTCDIVIHTHTTSSYRLSINIEPCALVL